MKSDVTARKVLGATAGAGVAGAIATVAIWIIQHPEILDLTVPAEVAAAITTIISAAASYYAGYNTLPSPEDEVVTDTDVAGAGSGAPARP
jgi:hypothetical protein